MPANNLAQPVGDGSEGRDWWSETNHADKPTRADHLRKASNGQGIAPRPKVGEGNVFPGPWGGIVDLVLC